MRMDKQFVNILEDVICQCCSPTKIISDPAQLETGKKVLEVLCALVIGSWQSEASINIRQALINCEVN